MNGAEKLVRTLLAGGVDVCFSNPGTSEMHFVSALDKVNEMRCVLALFEGVATGAADGYYRMAGKPASTLLHLGPGLANGIANLHNASKARSGIINIVGEHATYHLELPSPLKSDIPTLARPVSGWVCTSKSADAISADAAAAICAARSPAPQVATLILPADTAWSNCRNDEVVLATTQAQKNEPAQVSTIADLLRSNGDTLLLVGGDALSEKGLESLQTIAHGTTCKVLSQTFNARAARGGGRFSVDRLPYVVDQAVAALSAFEHIVLIGAEEPVAFFAYPNKPSRLWPNGSQLYRLSEPGRSTLGILADLADAVGRQSGARSHARDVAPEKPNGAMNATSIGQAIAFAIPENAIVVDEAITTGRGFFGPTAAAAQHDWLQNMGGSIGYSTPVAIGAAIACPDRKVICIVGDGSAMYTIQSLWTQARENLNITTVVFANKGYNILKGEFANVQAGALGRRASDMLELDRPDLSFVSLSKGMGVPATSVDTIDALNKALSHAMASERPRLIEVAM